MASTRGFTVPIKADASPVIAVIDVIVKHLTALRAELLAMAETEERDS